MSCRALPVLMLALLIAGPVGAQDAPPLPVVDPPPEGQQDTAPANGNHFADATDPLAPTGPVMSPVLTVDQESLFTRSAWGQRLQQEFERAGNALSEENDRLAEQLSAEEAELTAQRKTLEPAEFRIKAEAFDLRATEIRRERAQAAQDLNARADAEQSAFFQAAVPVMGRMMQERGAVVVLDRQTALISVSAIDITEDLIGRIDAELGDGSDGQTALPAQDQPVPAPAD